MIKKLFGRRQNEELYELLTEEVDPAMKVRTESVNSDAATLGQLEALSRAELVQLAADRASQINELKSQIEHQAKQIIQQRHVLENRDSSKELSRRLAQVEANHEAEAQQQRDQFQIQMKEMSIRVGELEGKLLTARTENSRLVKLLTNPESKSE